MYLWNWWNLQEFASIQPRTSAPKYVGMALHPYTHTACGHIHSHYEPSAGGCSNVEDRVRRFENVCLLHPNYLHFFNCFVANLALQAQTEEHCVARWSIHASRLEWSRWKTDFDPWRCQARYLSGVSVGSLECRAVSMPVAYGLRLFSALCRAIQSLMRYHYHHNLVRGVQIVKINSNQSNCIFQVT